MTVLVGMQLYSARGDAGLRQERAVRQLASLSDVEPVNLQFTTGAPFVHGDMETLAILTEDSLTVTGLQGPRKPLASEMCTALALEARRRGLQYFCLVNSDIMVTREAVEAIEAGGRAGYAFSRMDIDPQSGVDVGMMFYGIDALAVRPSWWLANSYRFRPFVLGEAFWDAQYTGLLVRHSDAVILNTRPLMRHVAHPRAWDHSSPLARYNGYLNALDARMFTRWCEYIAQLERACALRAPSDEENFALQAAVFRRPWPFASGLLHAARGIKAWASYVRHGGAATTRIRSTSARSDGTG